MQTVVPTRNRQVEEVIQKLEKVSNSVSLGKIILLIIFLENEIVIAPLLVHNVNNYLLEVVIKRTHVNLTQLLLGLVNLLILHHIFVHQTLISRHRLQNVQNVQTLHLTVR